MTNKTQSEAKIRALVEELQTLEFGCEIVQRFSVKKTRIISQSIMEKMEGDKYVVTTHGSDCKDVFIKRYKETDNYIIKILGKPIHLEDVLLAIERKTKSMTDMIATIGHYNFSLPFSEQSEDFYQFINEIL